MLPLKKILCPTDFSQPSFEALSVASALATQFGAELYVLHVMEPQEPVLGIVSVEEFERARSAEAVQSIYRQVDKLAGKNLKTRPIIKSGDAATEILQTATEEQPDLIVIATHGLTGWRHLVFGSVAEAVVNQAQKPVLTIHSKLQNQHGTF
jgi:nucleotide-binding universal stress UspA family protein